MKQASYCVGVAVLTLGLLGGTGQAMSQQVKDARGAAATMDEAARSTQSQIGKVVEETRKIVRDYNAVTKELEGLKVYNTLLQKQIDNQAQEMADLEHSINQVTVIERQVIPLMAQMVESLDQFVELDVPFLLAERRKRVAFLKTLLGRSDVTVAEKFRRVLEAYEIENDYGRLIEAYTDNLEVDGASREVEFLRVGRIALFYQTADGAHIGMWDREKKEWTSLPGEYRSQIREGIKMAQKQVAPDLLLLPVPAPEAAK